MCPLKKRPLSNKQSFSESDVCQLENIVTYRINLQLMTKVHVLRVQHFINYYTNTKYFLSTIVARLITQIVNSKQILKMLTIL